MNWKNGIHHLIERGIPVKDIAAVVGLAVSSVYDIKNGYSIEPSGMAAVRLYKLFKKHGFVEIKASKVLTDQQGRVATVIDLLGGTSAAARFFEIEPPSVSEWKEKGKIPHARLMYLRVARPDVYQAAKFDQDEA